MPSSVLQIFKVFILISSLVEPPEKKKREKKQLALIFETNFEFYSNKKPGSRSGIKIRIQLKLWILIRIKTYRIRNPGKYRTWKYSKKKKTV